MQCDTSPRMTVLIAVIIECAIWRTNTIHTTIQNARINSHIIMDQKSHKKTSVIQTHIITLDQANSYCHEVGGPRERGFKGLGSRGGGGHV